MQSALDNGLLDESHTLDIKKGPPGPGVGGARDIAVDLASFAVDGGYLVYGVDEDEHGRARALTPFPTAGFPERVDQVALSGRIDQPFVVTISVVPATAGDGLGYVIVTVPSSAAAPHMVDGQYRGRGGKTNRVLSDADVLRLHHARSQREESAGALLDLAVDRDLVPDPGLGHLFVVAHPTTGRPSMLQDSIDPDQGWQSWLHSEILSGEPCRRLMPQWSPDLSDSMQASPRADGWALHDHSVTSDRAPHPDGHEHYMLDVEITEAGSIRLFSGRATDDINRRRDGDVEQVILEVLVLGLTKRTLLVALTVGRAMGYVGQWDIGLAVTGIRGCRSYAASQNLFAGGGTPFSENEYRQLSTATTAELERDIDAAVRRLTGRLCRALTRGGYEAPPQFG